MHSFNEVLQEILKDFGVKPAEIIPLHEGLRRTLAQLVQAANDLPHFDNSLIMSGFLSYIRDTIYDPTTI